MQSSSIRKAITSLFGLIVLLSPALSSATDATNRSTNAPTVSAATSTFRCFEAPFQFPVKGYVGWIWKDPAAVPKEGHLHTGIDVWPFDGQGSPVYPLADGVIRRIVIGDNSHALNLWFPSVNGGTEVYYTHMKVAPNLIPSGNRPQYEVDIPVKATDVIGTVYGENWIHLSVGYKNGPYFRHNDLLPEQTQDPSPYFGAKLNYDIGDRGLFVKQSDALCDRNRIEFPVILTPGATDTLVRTIITPIIPSKPDIILLADTTGSMGNAIANVRAKAASVMNEVKAVQPAAQFGVAEYKDFNCDASPYRLDQAITDNTTAIQNAINNRWFASGGCDTPEAQLNALSQLATNVAAIGWRADSTRIVAWFGDAPGHDPSNGHTLNSTITALKTANIRVIAVNVVNLDGCAETCKQASAITDATSGKLLSLTSASAAASADGIDSGNNDGAITDHPMTNAADEVADAILTGLKSLPVTVTPQISACDPRITVAFDTPSITVTSGEAVTFTVTISVAGDVPVGTSITCNINYLLDGKPVPDDPGFVTEISVPAPPKIYLPLVATQAP